MRFSCFLLKCWWWWGFISQFTRNRRRRRDDGKNEKGKHKNEINFQTKKEEDYLSWFFHFKRKKIHNNFLLESLNWLHHLWDYFGVSLPPLIWFSLKSLFVFIESLCFYSLLVRLLPLSSRMDNLNTYLKRMICGYQVEV